MKIISAKSTDYDELVEAWEASVRSTHHFVLEEDIVYFKTLIKQYLAAADIFFIRENNTIIAFLGTADNEIQMLYLTPEAHGRGIGKLLTLFAIAECGVTKVEVNEQNVHAVGFYKHMGFKVVDRRELDYTGRPYPILCMELGSVIS